MRKILSTLVMTLLVVIVLQAQQEAHYTQFMYNNMLLNPAFAGARRVTSVMGLYRNQWIGFEGHPVSYLAAFDMPVSKSRLGTGLTLAHQQEGIVSRNFGNLALNYDIIHTEDMTFRAGLNGAIKQYRFDLQDPNIFVKNPTDELLIQQSPTIITSNVGAGLYFDMKSFYIGLSIPNLIKNPIELNKQKVFDIEGTEQRHVYLQAGGFFRLRSENLHLKPSIMLKYVRNAPISADLNLGLMFYRQFLIGGSFRTGNSTYGGSDSFDVLAYFQATDELGIGAAYDFTLTELKKYNKGSIELMMRYDFIKNKKVLHNPRFFF